MKKQQPKIFQLNTKVEKHLSLLEKMSKLISAGKFNEALKEGKDGVALYPDEPIFYIVQGNAFSGLNKFNEAEKILKEAENKFPGYNEIYFNLAKIYEGKSEYEMAEDNYLKAIKLTEKSDKECQSDFLNDLAVMYWTTGRKDEAVEKIKSAVKENPKNKRAKHNLDLFMKNKETNNSFFDDLTNFRKIHTNNYFRDKGRNEFLSEEEVNQVFNIIFDSWNNEVSAQHNKLDSLSVAEKSKWFKSIKVDFSKVKPGKKSKVKKKSKKKDDISKMIDEVNENLDFLPENAILVLPMVSTLLEEAGLSKARVEEILLLSDPTEEEENILQWGVEIGFLVLSISSEKDEDEKELLREEAVDIAADYVPRIKSRDILAEIEYIFEALIGIGDNKLPG